jgi:hypothetical protein
MPLQIASIALIISVLLGSSSMFLASLALMVACFFI